MDGTHAPKLHPARGAVNAAYPTFPGASFLAAAVALAVNAVVLVRIRNPTVRSIARSPAAT
jgi:hypothetical protein